MKSKDHTIVCPLCKKTAPWEGNAFRPFCSERCRLIDLGNWASEEYRIIGKKMEDLQGDEQDAQKSEQNSG